MEEKPDWIVAAMQGHLGGTIADTHLKGLKAQDFDIQESPDAYWSKESIQEAFGSDKSAFDNFYKQGKARYMALRQGEFDIQNFTLPPVTKAAGRNNLQIGNPRLSKLNPDVWGRSFGADMSTGGYSAKQRGWRESAIENGVKLPNGQYAKTREFDGHAKFALDEDGSFKLDEGGKPYLIPVQSGEELRTGEEIYNPLAESFGAYGHDYNGWQLLTSIPKNTINFTVDTIDSLLEFPKAIMAFSGLEPGDESYDNITDAQTSVRSARIGQTERGSESFFSLESLSDLSQQVVFQLAAMLATGGTVAGAAKLMGAAPMAASKAGSVAGKLLMTGMAAGPIAKVARDYNLSSKEAGILLGITSMAFYPLMSLSEKVIKGIGISHSNAAIAEAIEKEMINVTSQGFSKAALKSSLFNLRSTVKDFLYKADRTKFANLTGGAVNESAEEVAEQMVDLGVRNLYNFYNENIDENSPVAGWLGTKAQNKFQFDWAQEAKNLGYSAIGGAMGGAIAAKMFSTLGYRKPPVARDLHDMVMDGQEQSLYAFIDNMEKQGRLAPTWLDENNQIIKDANLSQNKAASNVLKGMVEYLVGVRDAAGISELKQNNEAKAKELSGLIRESSVGADAAHLNRSILTLNDKLNQLKANQTSAPDEIKAVQEELELRQQQLSRIVKGEFVNDYLSQALYNVNADPVSRKALDGKSFVNLTKTIPQIYEQANKSYSAEIAAFKQRDEEATLESPEGITEIGAKKLQQESETRFQDATKQLQPFNEQIEALIDMSIDEDPTEALARLKTASAKMPEGSPERLAAETAVKAQEDLKKAQTLPVLPLPEQPTLSSMFTTMVEPMRTTTGQVLNNSAITIKEKLQAEQATRKEMNKDGVSLYTGTERILPIVQSLNARLAQVKSLPAVANVINQRRMSAGDVLLPELDEKEQKKLVKDLEGMLKEATLLLEESETNANSSEVQLRKLTIATLSATAESIGHVAETLAGTPYSGLSEIAKVHFSQMNDALEKGDFDTALLVQKEFEKQAYAQFNKDRDGILEQFKGDIDTGKYESMAFHGFVETYNYLRGALSLNAVDFWNAYRATINNSNTANKAPSIEQEVIIKRAVQSLMAGTYDPKFYNFMSFTSPKGYKFPMNHNFSVFVEGEGGTGKTSQIISIVAGIIQKLDGGEVFLTSFKDDRGKKVGDLINKVRDYYQTSSNTSGIQLSSSNLSIQDFLADDNLEQVAKTNLIVFDEATLLTSDELAQIQTRLQEINALRSQVSPSTPLLKILYTGDTNQNVIDVDRRNPESTPDGIYFHSKHTIDRTRPLAFSFRQTNQQLKLLSAMLKKGQFIRGTGEPTQFEYSDKNEGVRVIHDQNKFYESASALIGALKAAGTLDRAVYITEKSKTELPSDIVLSGIVVLTSEQAQSEEWDYVFYDPKDKEIYKNGQTNLVGKKSMYTAVTRARNFIMMSLPDTQPFSSRKGQVHMIKPLSPEAVTREAHLARIDRILGPDISETAEQRVNYTYVPATQGWSGDQLFPAPTSKNEASPIPGAPSPTPPPSPATPTPAGTEKGIELKTGDIPSALAELIDLVNKKDTVSLNTFYTAYDNGMSVTQQFDLKRQMFSSPKVRAATSVFLTVAKIGSPGYQNIVRNDPAKAGAYAVFVEGIYEGQRVIIGVLPAMDPSDPSFSIDRIIRETGLMNGQQEIRIPLNSSILATAADIRPQVKDFNVGIKSLGFLTNESPGINFGEIGILTQDIPSKNPVKIIRGGKIVDSGMFAGEPFIPVSFTLSSQEIKTRLQKSIYDREITLIPLRSEKLPFEEIEATLQEYLNAEGKLIFSGEAAIVYDSMFGHLGETRTAPGDQATNAKKNLLGQAFRDIIKKVNPETDPAYYNFLTKYALPETNLENRAIIQDVKRQFGEEADIHSASNAKYFMKNYIERKASGKPATLFERAIKDLKAQPMFAKGFDFDPQLSKSSSASPVFGFARTLPQHFYNSYLSAHIGEISTPSVRIPKVELLNAIKNATPEVRPEAQPNIVTTDGKTFDFSKSEKTEGNQDFEHMMRQFGQLEVKTLVDFQQHFFKGPAIELLQKATETFKRGMFSSIFKVRGPVPSIASIEDIPANPETGAEEVKGAVTEYREYLEKKAEMFPAKWNNFLTNPDEQAHYIDTVLAQNFDFLMELYFPTIKKTDRGYSFGASHHKIKSFAEKDSVSLLHEGMNEMILTQLFNTPILTRDKSGNLVTMKDSSGNTRYISRTDIEEVTTELTGMHGLDEIEEVLSRNPSPIIQSIYHRFIARQPFTVDGVPTWSIGSIQEEQAWKIRDAVLSFFLSGEVYNMAFVDNSEGTYALPVSVFGRPNIIREQGMESINTRMSEMSIPAERETYFYSDKLGKLDKKPIYSPEETIRYIKAIGIEWFNQNHLNDILANEADGLGIQTESQVNKYLVDNVVFATLRAARNGKVSYSGNLDVVFRSIARVEGIQSSLNYINLAGDLVYRLRNTSPVFNYRMRLEEVKQSPTSALQENMLVKGLYRIKSLFIKDGFTDTFHGRDISKHVSKLDSEELMELDIMWGFVNTLKESYRRTGNYSQAAIPFLVYGDSRTDITPIVEADNFFRTPETILQDLFNAQAVYYTRLEKQILAAWSQVPGMDSKSLSDLKAALERNPIPVSEIEKLPGMIKNLYYDKGKGGMATIKQELIASIGLYSNSQGYPSFVQSQEAQVQKLIAKAKEVRSGDDTLYKKLGTAIEGKSADAILKAFHYNWLAFTESMRQITTGPKEQYKGKNESTEYIDMVKRAKAEASTHSVSLYRRYDWADRVAKEGLTPELIYEGKKMPRYVKVAYVKDIVRPLFSLAGETKGQEVWDGATFVTPLTRIFQRHAQGGEFGIQTPPVMKNITTMFNPENGVKTFIKNAEFEITPEILAVGTDEIRQAVKMMLDQPFQNSEGSAYQKLVEISGSADLSGVTREHFESLADFLVQSGEQGSVIMELIPNTSAKTGQGAINDFIPAEGRYTTEVLDLANKGTQLDASHEPYQDMRTTLPTQLMNALSIGWKTPNEIMNVYNALANIANRVSDSVSSLSVQALKDKVKAIIRTSVETKQNISYVNGLVKEDFSVDDRQVINMFTPNWNSDLSNEAISFSIQGGQYVLHPSDGIVQVFDTENGVVLRDKAPAGAVGRELQWKSPVRKSDGVSLEELVMAVHTQVTGYTDPISILASYEQNPALKAQRDHKMRSVRAELESGEWTPGEAEIIMPMEMQRDFGLEEGMSIQDVTPEFFAKQLKEKASKSKFEADEQLFAKQAEQMFLAFQERLKGNNIRIPTTGKHSSVNTRIVAFLDGSLNSMFVPSMMLFIQGADQDIDKGNYLTYEMFKGMLPMVARKVVTTGSYSEDENQVMPDFEETDELELIAPDLYKKEDQEKAWKIGVKNYLVQNLRKIMGDSKNVYEANVSVDSALQVLKDLRDQKNAASEPYEWDSYLSYARMHEIAQVAKSLVGIFANSQKAYQVLYSLYKSKGLNSNAILADLGMSEGTETWIKIAGLINAATDDLKEQILGVLGINETNAGMVSYLVTRGWELPEVVQFLEANKADLEKMKYFRKYNVHRSFKPEEEWKKNPRLVQLYRLAEEFTTIAQSIMNREVPSSAYDMFMYGNRIEKFVNDSYQRAKLKVFFDFDKFMTSPEYAAEQVELYETLIQRELVDNSEAAQESRLDRRKEGEDIEVFQKPRILGNHAYNLLEVLKDSPHVSAYLRLYKTSKDAISKVSRIIPAVNRLATEYSYGDGGKTNIISDRQYRDMMDFVYGIAIDKYFKEFKTTEGKFELFTPEGRTDFVKWMATDGLAKLKREYPDNPFVNSLAPTTVTRYKYEPAPIIRTFDLMNVTEEKMLELRVGLEQLKSAEREALINYAMIVNRGAMGKGSFSQLFHVDDLRKFNDFLNSMAEIEAPRFLYEQFTRETKFKAEERLLHNAIPYELPDSNRASAGGRLPRNTRTEIPYTGSSPDDGRKREALNYLNNLASEEEIEEFLDEVDEDLEPDFYKTLKATADRKLRRLRGTTSKSSEETQKQQNTAIKKWTAIKRTLLNADEEADGKMVTPRYYKAMVMDIESLFSFKKLAEYRELLWGMKKISKKSKWALTKKIQERFDELNGGKYSNTFKERQQTSGYLSYNNLKEMLTDVEPNDRGTLDKKLYMDIKHSIETLPEKEREEIYTLMGKIPELNPAVIEKLRQTTAPFQMAAPPKKNPRNPVVMDNVVDFVNRVAGTQIRKGLKFEDTLDLNDIRGYSGKINFGASFIDFVESLKKGRKANKADKVMLGDILAYYDALKNKKNLNADVEERIRTCGLP